MIYNVKIRFIIALQVLAFPAALSQSLLDQSAFFAGGTADAQKIFQAYAGPWASMYGHSLNNGWVNTAKTHKPFGFDLTITNTVAIAPRSEKTFDIAELGLNQLGKSNGSTTVAQTTVGNNNKKNDRPSLDLLSPYGTYSNVLSIPKGSGFPATILPAIQIGMGLMKETEISIRYSPPINYGRYGTINHWGIAMKHNLRQYLPAARLLPFDISVMAAISQLNNKTDVTNDPQQYLFDPGITFDKTDRSIKMGVTAWNTILSASTSLPFFNIIGSIGYSGIMARMKATGTYPIPSGETDFFREAGQRGAQSGFAHGGGGVA